MKHMFTQKFLNTMHHKIRNRVISILNTNNSIIILKGGTLIPIYNTDETYQFKQESNFFICLV